MKLDCTNQVIFLHPSENCKYVDWLHSCLQHSCSDNTFICHCGLKSFIHVINANFNNARNHAKPRANLFPGQFPCGSYTVQSGSPVEVEFARNAAEGGGGGHGSVQQERKVY